MDKKELLKLKKKKKKNKPKFLRRNHNTKKRLSKKWRKPKGLHNKMRLNKRGYSRTVAHGYGSPKEIKYLDPKTGLLPVVIHNKKELLALDSKKEGALISSKVGAKKRLKLMKAAEDKNITILQNTKKMKETIKKKKEEKKKKQKEVLERKKKAKKKKKKKEEKEKKEKEEKKKDEENEVHDNEETKKSKEADKMNKEILQKRV